MRFVYSVGIRSTASWLQLWGKSVYSASFLITKQIHKAFNSASWAQKTQNQAHYDERRLLGRGENLNLDWVQGRNGRSVECLHFCPSLRRNGEATQDSLCLVSFILKMAALNFVSWSSLEKIKKIHKFYGFENWRFSINWNGRKNKITKFRRRIG